jgi:hypothetical protein
MHNKTEKLNVKGGKKGSVRRCRRNREIPTQQTDTWSLWLIFAAGFNTWYIKIKSYVMYSSGV